MKGVIGFSRSSSWISKAIRWFRDSHISHTFIIINNGERLFVLEASKREVLISPYKKKFSKDYVELYVPKASDRKIAQAIDTMFNYVEKRYGYLQIIGLAMVSLLRKVGINVKNPIGTGIICSELVHKFVLLLGFNEFNQLDPNTVSPDDLLRIIKKSKKFTKVEIIN